MERELILKQAIEKASERKEYADYVSTQCFTDYLNNKAYDSIIFDHNFCKAFWGEEKVKCRDCKTDHGICNPILKHPFYDDCPKIWKIRIQQLALSKDRLEYISKFLK